MLALPALQQLLGLLADLLGQPQDLDLLREDAQQLVEALLDIECLEQVLLLGRRQIRDIGDEVGERRRRLDLLDGEAISVGSVGNSEIASRARSFSWCMRAAISVE